jgi:hypothetical protein
VIMVCAFWGVRGASESLDPENIVATYTTMGAFIFALRGSGTKTMTQHCSKLDSKDFYARMSGLRAIQPVFPVAGCGVGVSHRLGSAYIV